MNSLFRMIALFVMIVLTPRLYAAGLISSAQMLFPAQDNRWQLVRFKLAAYPNPRLQQGTMIFSDARGGPRIIRSVDFSSGDTPSLLVALPLVSADELQDSWPIMVEFASAAGKAKETVNIEISREAQPTYHLLVQHEALVETGSLRAISPRPVRIAEFSAGELPATLGADGILLPRGLLRRSEEIPRSPLASGVDIWAQGATPPVDAGSPVGWQRIADSSQGPELTLWRLASPAAPLAPVDPLISQLPAKRAVVPQSIRWMALWIPLAGTVLILATWLLARRAWIVAIILALILPCGTLGAILIVRYQLEPQMLDMTFGQGMTHSRIVCQHTYLSSSDLLASHLSISQNQDLPAVPLAANPQQWFGMKEVQIPGDPGNQEPTTVALPSRRLVILNLRKIQLPLLTTSPAGDLFKGTSFEKSGQTWNSWLDQRPQSEQNSWRAWWLLMHQLDSSYLLSAGDLPVAWQVDESP